MEIYKDLTSPENQQFEKLLNSQLSKNVIEEGKIIDGKITKITDNGMFCNGELKYTIFWIKTLELLGIQRTP